MLRASVGPVLLNLTIDPPQSTTVKILRLEANMITGDSLPVAREIPGMILSIGEAPSEQPFTLLSCGGCLTLEIGVTRTVSPPMLQFAFILSFWGGIRREVYMYDFMRDKTLSVPPYCWTTTRDKRLDKIMIKDIEKFNRRMRELDLEISPDGESD